jgi:hypothetical protein
MSGAALSVFVFGIYLILSGLGFTFLPNTVLGLFGLPATQEPWIRIVGWLMVLIGYYYLMSGRRELRQFFPWTVIARTSVFVIFVLFYVLNWAPWTLLIFGIVDLLGAIWTYLAQRSS